MIRRGLLAVAARWLGRLRNPYLFAIAAAILLADLAIPDFIPFADELLLAIVTLILGGRKKSDETTSDGDTSSLPGPPPEAS